MITGRVEADQCVIPIALRGPTGRTTDVDAVVDTGFTNALALPSALIDELQLRWHGQVEATLADGTVTNVAIHECLVMWDGVSRAVAVTAIEGAPLIGMRLLNGFRFTADVRRGGELTIETLSDSE